MYSIVDRIRENKLKWLGHNLRREEEYAIRLVKKTYVRKEKKRKTENRWLGVIENDMKRAGVNEDVGD